MNHLEAQQKLAKTIQSAASKVNGYFWRLSGDEPNSLCKFLCMEEEELKKILRLCQIYIGDKDKFHIKNFESLMEYIHCDYTTIQMNGKRERFIKLGGDSVGMPVVLPNCMYDSDGSLLHLPVEDVHVRNLRTKSQRGSLPELLDVGNGDDNKKNPPTQLMTQQNHNQPKAFRPNSVFWKWSTNSSWVLD